MITSTKTFPIIIAMLLALAMTACDRNPPLKPEAGPEAGLEAGPTSVQVSGPDLVTIDFSEPFDEVSGYTYVEATMHGTVERDDGSEGNYAVPMILIYPNDGGNGVGVVDWPASGYYGLTGYTDPDESMTIDMARLTTDGYLFENGYTYASVQWSKAVTELFADIEPGDDANHLVRGTIEDGRDAFHILRDAAGFLRDPGAFDGADAPSPVNTVLSFGFSHTAGLQLEFLRQGENLDNGVPVYDGHLRSFMGAYCEVPNNDPPGFSTAEPCFDLPSGQEPMITLVPQTDLKVLFAAYSRNPDDPNWRQYELAGVSHLPTPILELPVSDPEVQQNPIDPRPVFRAVFRNLTLWVTEGIAAPPSKFIEGEITGDLVFDQFHPSLDDDGNVLGGLRLPHMEQDVNGKVAGAPLGIYSGLNMAGFPDDVFLVLSGTFTPFSDERLAELYPNRGAYVNRVTRAAGHLRQQGYILQEDKNAYVREAAQRR